MKGEPMKEYAASKMLIDREGDVEVFIEGDVEYSIDKRYGEDADGNRGEPRFIAEDVYNFQAELDGEIIQLTPQEEERAKEILTDKVREG